MAYGPWLYQTVGAAERKEEPMREDGESGCPAGVGQHQVAEKDDGDYRGHFG